MGSSISTQDAYEIAMIVLAAVCGFLVITLIITCCCCFKQQRKLLRTAYGPESGGPQRSRMKRHGKHGLDNRAAQSSPWMSNPYDRWTGNGPPGTAPCPNCHSKVECGCHVQPPERNWTPPDNRGITALPRSNPYNMDSGPPNTHIYDNALLNAKSSADAGAYGALPKPKYLSTAIEGPRGGAPYSTDYGQNIASSQMGLGSSYNNMESSTAQFVLEPAKRRY